jgi:hypothetical protein
VIPHAVAVSDTRLATIGIGTPSSWLISSRKGARVVPLELAAKQPRHEAAINAQGIARSILRVPPAFTRAERNGRGRLVL